MFTSVLRLFMHLNHCTEGSPCICHIVHIRVHATPPSPVHSVFKLPSYDTQRPHGFQGARDRVVHVRLMSVHAIEFHFLRERARCGDGVCTGKPRGMLHVHPRAPLSKSALFAFTMNYVQDPTWTRHPHAAQHAFASAPDPL